MKKRFLILVTVLTVLVSCFSAFTVVSADGNDDTTNYQYNGSNIIVYATTFNSSNGTAIGTAVTPLAARFDMSNVSTSPSVYFTFDCFYNLSYNGASAQSQLMQLGYFDGSNYITSNTSNSSYPIFTNNTINFTGTCFYDNLYLRFAPTGAPTAAYVTKKVNFRCNLVSDNNKFIPDIISVRFWSVQNQASQTNSMNYITYTNKYADTVTVGFYCVQDWIAGTSVSNFALFDDRTYYLTQESSETVEEAYQRGYNYGLSQLSEAQNEKYLEGYNKGFDEGYDLAVNSGDGGEYSFLGLFGSILDAPVQAFSGLLNFEIFGFNLLNLFTAILTMCLIILVLRKFF